jgi:hypothetical protein
LVAIELEEAMRCWDARTDPAAAAKSGTIINPNGALVRDAASPASESADRLARTDPHGYHVERAKSERFRAAQAELDYLESLGRVVPADVDEAVRFRRYRSMRDQLVNIADRLAPVVAAERDAARVHAAIAGEIRRVLNELSDTAITEIAGGTERSLGV